MIRILLLLVLLIIVAAFYWLQFHYARLLTPQLETQLTAALGCQVQLRGDVDVGLLPSPEISLQDLLCREMDGDEVLASIDRIVVDAEWEELMDGQLQLQEILLQRPQVFFSMDEKGDHNWAFLQSGSSSGSANADLSVPWRRLEIEGLELFVHAQGQSWTLTEASGFFDSGLRFFLSGKVVGRQADFAGNLEVRGALANQGAELVVRDLAVKVDMTRPWVLKAETVVPMVWQETGVWRANALALAMAHGGYEGSVSGNLTYSPALGQVVAEGLVGKVNNYDLFHHSSFHYFPGEAQPYRLQINLETEHVAALVGDALWWPVALDAQAFDPFSAVAHVTGGEGGWRVDLDAFAIGAGDTVSRGSGFVQGPPWQVEMQVDQLDVGRYLSDKQSADGDDLALRLPSLPVAGKITVERLTAFDATAHQAVIELQ